MSCKKGGVIFSKKKNEERIYSSHLQKDESHIKKEGKNVKKAFKTN